MSYGAQRYSKPRSSTKKERKPNLTRHEMVRRARQRIIGATRKRGGYIAAASVQDAVKALKKWVRNDDGKLGPRNGFHGIIARAFRELHEANVFSRLAYGYKLNAHVVIST